jgi:hypothetical protein
MFVAFAVIIFGNSGVKDEGLSFWHPNNATTMDSDSTNFWVIL